MKEMNRFIALISIALIACLFCSVACADGIVPYADDIFHSAYPAFYSDGEVDFECDTYEISGVLYVKNCRLQKKNADGDWENVGYAINPSARGYNVHSFGYTIDFSSRITSGEYRAVGTFVSDGHAITRYSRVLTF